MKLSTPPDKAAIRAGKRTRTIDYWQQWGAWYARAWPEKSTKPRTEGEIASSGAFTCAAIWSGKISKETRLAYINMGSSPGETWVDLFRAMARHAAPLGVVQMSHAVSFGD